MSPTVYILLNFFILCVCLCASACERKFINFFFIAIYTVRDEPQSSMEWNLILRSVFWGLFVLCEIYIKNSGTQNKIHLGLGWFKIFVKMTLFNRQRADTCTATSPVKGHHSWWHSFWTMMHFWELHVMENCKTIGVYTLNVYTQTDAVEKNIKNGFHWN